MAVWRGLETQDDLLRVCIVPPETHMTDVFSDYDDLLCLDDI